MPCAWATDEKMRYVCKGELHKDFHVSILDGVNYLIDEYGDALKADIVVLSHHGQNGASREFYQKVAPEIAIWQTPSWLWDNDSGGGPGSGSWKTNYVKCWLQDLGIRKQFRNVKDIIIE